VVLIARGSDDFPPDAEEIMPLDSPQASFLVATVGTAGRTLRIDAPDDGTFPPGPAIIRIILADSSKQLAAYDSVAAVLPDSSGAAGLIFTAPPNLPFPSTATRAQPTAGFASGGSGVSFGEDLPVVSDAASTEALGPPAAVHSVAKDGSSAAVGPYSLFPEAGGEVNVLSRSGDTTKVQIDWSERRVSADGSLIEHILHATPGGTPFPSNALTAQPLKVEKLQVGAAVPGAAVYTDDPVHQLLTVPDALKGLEMVLNDNAARGSSQEEVLAFTIRGWSKVFILRPDATCDHATLPPTCTYLTADIPTWLALDFLPRPVESYTRHPTP
ncbi:hypothetical protein T484DRAFT_1788868, partial [Baffinella frigidus]